MYGRDTFRKLYKQVDQLPDEDRQALVVLLDSLGKRAQVGKVMAG